MTAAEEAARVQEAADRCLQRQMARSLGLSGQPGLNLPGSWVNTGTTQDVPTLEEPVRSVRNNALRRRRSAPPAAP